MILIKEIGTATHYNVTSIHTKKGRNARKNGLAKLIGGPVCPSRVLPQDRKGKRVSAIAGEST